MRQSHKRGTARVNVEVSGVAGPSSTTLVGPGPEIMLADSAVLSYCEEGVGRVFHEDPFCGLSMAAEHSDVRCRSLMACGSFCTSKQPVSYV
jgi:hypothetical protein